MNIHWKSVVLTLLSLAILGLIAATIWVSFGLYNVSARLGHFPGMSWVFHTTYRNSVELWSDETREVPDTLDTPEMIALGAKHFEAACRMCHAAPGARRTATARAMLPQPPHITDAVGHWTPIQLHWIVHEGVKMSGMPGWPASREEEVWPVVAFLLAVQDGMTPKTYASLTAKMAASPSGMETCASCHGEGGATDNPHVPRLDILSERYIVTALGAYLDGSRQSGIMEHAASEVSEEALTRFAAHYGDISPPEAGTVDRTTLSDLEEQGRRLAFATEGADDDVPACRACHGPWEEELDTLFPSLAGQHEPYLAQQLRLWREEMRGGGLTAELMHQASRDLSDADIEALAAFYAALPPSELNAIPTGLE